ncbi:Sarcoplasmic/endoplasmic reticulum calcium ATPase [Seminavis robusta]|uniref:Sarcoplasmic/endoplasmic reticulum calcium ATPase n=1 Tax=Seminavis robusta TaxID=568900 RepID=A0A9N8DJ29_9STRA|nr:Sarcoplasmic/endoplasmic reticulum calcium ATPase [Seminavis robusta]|eukprot:Sro110_g054830.1 Sarcoplasmic/endoplasmic reticulum calcium ATPase (1177) ;mRNA; f:33206-37282
MKYRGNAIPQVWLFCSMILVACTTVPIILVQGSRSSSLASIHSYTKNSNRHNHKLAFVSTLSSPRTWSQRLQRLRGGSSSSLLLAYNESSTDAGSLSITDLLDQLQTSPTNGLTQEDAQQRLQQYGSNVLERPPSKSVWQLILEQFEDRLVQILLVVALLSGVFSFLELRNSVAVGAEEASLWKSFVEPLVILAILVLNAAVGVWQSQSASDSLEALQKLQPTLATVVRQTQQQQQLDTTIASSASAEMDASNLVPGDILEIRVGDKIPADSRLLSLKSSSLKVDEGSLTGESVTVSKLPGEEGTVAPDSPVQDQVGMLYSGTMVTSGSGVAVVVQTGMDTQFGKIQKGVTQAKDEEEKTPLAIKLDEFGETLTIIIGVICLAVWVVSIPKFNDASFSSPWEGAIYYAKVSVALGVAAIPEGLPAVITLCLSLGTRKMAQRNVIVRKLQSVETLGCTSVICTDKTGTLTTNEMTSVSLVVVGEEGKKRPIVEEHRIDGVSYSPIGSIDGIEKNREVIDNPDGAIADIAAVSALCNDAKIVGRADEPKNDGNTPSKKKKKKDDSTSEKEYQRIGEPTEAALCVLAEKIGGMAPVATDNDQPPPTPATLASANVLAWRDVHPRHATLEFNRDRKSMSVLCEFSKEANKQKKAKSIKAGNRLLVKGAPNLLLQRCTHVKTRNGNVVRLSGELRRKVEAKISEMAARPLRCLALAVKDNDDLESSLRRFSPSSEGDVAKHPLLSKQENYKNIESGLTLVGIAGIKDPARPEVADSIKACTKAGIRVMMITGDARDTAVAIARDVNIFPPDDAEGGNVKAFEGREFFHLPPKKQLELLKEDNLVFCRAEPADKQRLVKMLQSLHEVTAMTGDGVNDAPALQQAAIGVAMGKTGTDVSKSASDMILADDNFATIVSAVEEGRRIYANMQAFICFLISCNIGEICAIFFATVAGFPEPLTAMHLLWVNLVTDGPPATALGFNPPSPDLMEQPPRPSDEPIMTTWLLTRYCLTGLYVGLATIGVFAGHYMAQGITLAQLRNWSQCGVFWSPLDQTLTCVDLFQGSGRMLPQTLALTTLVCMEMFKALSAVSVDSSLIRIGPQENPWLLLGVSGPFLLHLFVLYSSNLGMPALGESFGMVPLSMDDWITVLQWSAPILVVDEVLKGIGRWLKQRKQPEMVAKGSR